MCVIGIKKSHQLFLLAVNKNRESNLGIKTVNVVFSVVVVQKQAFEDVLFLKSDSHLPK